MTNVCSRLLRTHPAGTIPTQKGRRLEGNQASEFQRETLTARGYMEIFDSWLFFLWP